MSNKTKCGAVEKIQQELGNNFLVNMGHKRYKASMVYARALFQFALETNMVESIYNSFGDFICVWQDVPILRQFIRCHAIDRNTRKARFKEFFQDRIHRSILCLIDKMIDNQHTDLLSGIYHAFSQMADDVNDRRRVRVISAFPLNPSQKKRLSGALEEALKLQIILNNEVDPDVLGGFVCYTDSIKIDMSLKKDFEKLKAQILSKPCEGDKTR